MRAAYIDDLQRNTRVGDGALLIGLDSALCAHLLWKSRQSSFGYCLKRYYEAKNYALIAAATRYFIRALVRTAIKSR